MRGLEAGPRPQPRPRIDPNGLDGYFSTIVQPQKLTVSQSIVDGVPRILGNIDTTLSEFAGNHSVTRERSNLRLVHSVPNEEVSEAEKTAPLLRRPNKETVGSDAFNLEYDSPPTQAELRRDIEAYLKEYRLKVQKHDYRLLFGRQADGIGPITLRDEDRGESLSRRAKRSVASRQLKEQPIHREEAEDEGLTLLNEQLRFSQDGDTVVWGSPPGPKEEGYGEYGFLYVGKVSKMSNNEASLDMKAIRIDKPSLEQYNAALSEIIGEDIKYEHEEEFLARPRVVHKNFSTHEVDAILQKNFDFVPDDKDREIANRVIGQMGPMFEDFIEVMQGGTREERIKAFYALENYALKLKKQEVENQGENVIYMNTSKGVRLKDIINNLGFMPPRVAGSCGSSDGYASSNSITSISGSENLANSIFGKDDLGDRAFHCPECNELNIRPYNDTLPKCQKCGSEKVAC